MKAGSSVGGPAGITHIRDFTPHQKDRSLHEREGFQYIIQVPGGCL